jgi:hypothetical protein
MHADMHLRSLTLCRLSNLPSATMGGSGWDDAGSRGCLQPSSEQSRSHSIAWCNDRTGWRLLLVAWPSCLNIVK